ncbi:hypothetical protein QSG82_12270 [Klebsiella pneumoniae]|uniref:hypothetical protein n=1 Tax=Klebsiella pneumoniae TaxID=573 RepID=UPI002572D045|nr:hypothetical protein [Klebsiella pneumoniae]WJG06712.1 hypothetical protein QSG82_12270 [Klebsiella pneumoniae]
MGEISVKTGNNARNGGKNSLNRLIRCVCGKKIGPDPRNFNQRVSLGRNDLLIRTFPNNVLIKKPNEIFAGDDFEFQTISYPSEMHMWEGLLFFEKKRGIFFSSDLMFGMGENHGQVIESSWDAAVKSSGADTLPNQESGQKLSSDLSEIEPKFVASGHGFCITIVG